MMFPVVRELVADGVPVVTACRVLHVSTSGYYDWRDRPPSARAVGDIALTETITAAHVASYGTYGARRIHAECGSVRACGPAAGGSNGLMRALGCRACTGAGCVAARGGARRRCRARTWWPGRTTRVPSEAHRAPAAEITGQRRGDRVTTAPLSRSAQRRVVTASNWTYSARSVRRMPRVQLACRVFQRLSPPKTLLRHFGSRGQQRHQLVWRAKSSRRQRRLLFVSAAGSLGRPRD